MRSSRAGGSPPRRASDRRPDIEDAWLSQLLGWADEFRTLEVWANADHPEDARRARALGAQGIGLCRTEHMFFEENRLPVVVRLLDPPLREFLPDHRELLRELADLKLRLQHLSTLQEIDDALDEIREKQDRTSHTRSVR